MKKVTLISVTVLLVMLLFAISAVVAAPSDDAGAITCALDITFDDYGDGLYWFGSVSGPECSVEGAIRFDAVRSEYRNPGKTLHFVEEFTIWPGSDDQSGDWIKGKICGVWNLTTFNYRAHGWVTNVSNDQWAHLVGSQYHEKGTTGNPAEGLPVEAPGGEMKVTPGNRQVLSPDDLCAPPED